jgi:hypothetical protein
MLYIQDMYTDEWITWHYSEPVPVVNSKVVAFQADGDELELILNAMRATNPKNKLTQK